MSSPMRTRVSLTVRAASTPWVATGSWTTSFSPVGRAAQTSAASSRARSKARTRPAAPNWRVSMLPARARTLASGSWASRAARSASSLAWRASASRWAACASVASIAASARAGNATMPMKHAQQKIS